MAASNFSFDNLPVIGSKRLASFKDAVAKYATDHELTYGSESLLPKSSLEVGKTTEYGTTYNRVVDFLNSLGAGQVNNLIHPKESGVSAGHETWGLSTIEEDRLANCTDALFDLCRACGVPNDRLASTVDSLGTIINRYTGTASISDHFTVPDTASLSGIHSLNSLYPNSIMSDVTYIGDIVGKEMFGVNVQQNTLDIKSAMTLTILKGYKGLTNRIAHRVSNDTGSVMFTVPNDEFYDLNNSQDKSSAVRDSWSHRNQLITLKTNPEPVDMEMIPVHLQKKLDPDGKFLLTDDVILPNKEVCLWDLSIIEGKPGYDQFNYTDLLSYNISLRAVHVEIEGKDGSKEQYVLNLSSYGAQTNFTHMNNTINNQADRAINFMCRLPFDKDLRTADNTMTTLFSSMNRSVEYVMGVLSFSAMTNIQTTRTHGYGTLEFRPAVSVKGAQPSEALMALVKDLKATIIGWEIDARYSEENFRKTNMAVRALSDVFTYTLPDGRTIVVDYSHKQTLAEHSLQVASEVQTIGIDHRNLQIILKTINATYDRVKNERTDKRYIENYDNLTVAKSFVSGRRVHPTIALKTIDMSKVANWRSSDMLSDNWVYMRACMNAITSEINYRSLLQTELEDRPVKYKCITTTPLLDCIWSLACIHENQMPSGKSGEMVFDAKTPGKPVEFKTKLPNGVEIEFVTTVFHYMKDTMVLIPYRDNAPLDDLNFMINFDGGQYSVNWSPTDGHQQTIRRSMQNTREFPITTCGIAALITVQNYDHLTPGMFNIEAQA